MGSSLKVHENVPGKVDRYLAQRTFSIGGKKGAGRLPCVSTIRRSCREISHCGRGSAPARTYHAFPELSQGRVFPRELDRPSAAGDGDGVLFISSASERVRVYTFAESRDSGSVPVYYSGFWDVACARARALQFSFSAHREIPRRTFYFPFAGVVYLHHHDHDDEQHVDQNETCN